MHIVGLDEIGRGSLAGPVYVGAATAPEGVPARFEVELGFPLRDSKQLTGPRRTLASEWLRGHVPYAFGSASAAEIDEIGLSAALKLAADRAIETFEGMHGVVWSVQADAGLFHSGSQPTTHTVKGDETVACITFASILAKVERDGVMTRLAAARPGYRWERNAGYGSAAHYAALEERGPALEHRRSFLRRVLVSEHETGS